MKFVLNRSCSHVMVVGALVFSGCTGVSPESLRRAQQEKTIEVSEAVKWKLGFWDVTLRPGVYSGKFEDDNGTYFVGPSPCVFMTGRVGSGNAGGSGWDCGIYVPRKEGAEPVVLTINASNREIGHFKPDGSPSFDLEPPLSAKLPATSASSGTPSDLTMPNLLASQHTVAGVAGGALGGAIVDSIVVAERGRFQEFKTQPAKGWLVHATKVAK